MTQYAYEFTVRAVGHGDDEQEAWEDAWEYLIQKIQEGNYDEALNIGRVC